jgi:NhaC family Na+:H+ antiporter
MTVDKKEKLKPSLTFSVITLAALVLFVALGVGVLKLNIALLLFLSWMVVAPFGAKLGYDFRELEGFAYNMAKECLAPAAIIMSVGILIGAWLASGTVPTVLVVGLSVISPKLFLFITFALCSVVSMIMGTSWGTMGTVGVAMLGVGNGLGINPAITVGAIVSGAYFGDKMSPMSDSTNLCATVTKTDIMEHIKYMSLSSIPAWIISAIIYTGIGFAQAGSYYDHAQIDFIISSLNSVFKIDIIPIIPIAIVIILLFRRKSVVMSLLIGALSGAAVVVLYQGFSVVEIGNFMFKGFSIQTDNAILANLLNRGGMVNMLTLIATFIGALGLGGMLNESGMLQPLLDALSSRIKTSKSLMIITMIITWISVAVIPTNNFAFAMIGTLFPPLFEQYNLKSHNLARILEDCGTLGNVLVPWSVGAMFVTGTLGIPATQYAPYAFQNYITPLISMIFILTNYKIRRIDESE